MRLFFAYLRRHSAALGMFAILFGLMGAVFLLYDVPLSAVGYAGLLCLFVGGVLCAGGYVRFRRRHKRLAALAERVSLAENGLPAPGDLIEGDYQALIDALRREAAGKEAESERRARDMADYYTLWAHQIKTPLAAMELMLRQHTPPEPAELREQLQRVEQYVDMALGYLRVSGGVSDFVLGRYDLDGIVRDAVKKYASQFIRRRIRLDYEPLNETVLTDEKWLRFVLEQVLSNALKYTRTGSVSIYMEPDKTLAVRDTGVGIRPEDLPRVFEKGYTGYNGRAEQKSTGIGLYLCRRVCGMLGHAIAVESAPGEGTTVYINLGDKELDTE